LIRKHCEALNISPDPPRNETDITQNKKIRQCVFTSLPKKDLEHFIRRIYIGKK